MSLSDTDLALCRFHAMDNTPVILGIAGFVVGAFFYNMFMSISSLVSHFMNQSTWIII
jgi:hypothetical protein